MKKEITSFFVPFFRLKGKCRPLVAMLLACAAADGVRAQGDVSPWVGEPLPVEGGEFYLYNKAGGGFLL